MGNYFLSKRTPSQCLAYLHYVLFVLTFNRVIKTLEQVNRHFSLQYHLGNYMYSDSIVRKLHEDLLSVWMQKAIEIDIWLPLAGYFSSIICSSWRKVNQKSPLKKNKNKMTANSFNQLLFFCEKDKFEVNVTLSMKYCKTSWPWKACQQAVSFGLP